MEPPRDLSFLESIEYGKCSVQIRPRLELVEPSATDANSATAETVRTEFAWLTRPWRGFSATVEALGVLHLNDNFDDSAPGKTPSKSQYARVSDPKEFDFNRLFAEYWSEVGGIFSVTARAGRQTLSLDNQRFIADDDFRQTSQIFSGFTTDLSAEHADLFLGQIYQRRDVFGSEHRTSLTVVNARFDLSNDDLWSPLYRQRMGDSDESWKNTDRVSFYGYWQDEAKLQIRTGATPAAPNGSLLCTACSNRITGLRIAGAHAVDLHADSFADFWSGPDRWNHADRALLYTVEYARQSSFHGGLSAIDAHYDHYGIGVRFAIDASWWQQVARARSENAETVRHVIMHRSDWSANDFYVRLDEERLGSNKGLFSFQTPLGNLHAFQGSADQFLTTPASGLIDRYVTVGALLTSDFIITGASGLHSEFHRYRTDQGGQTLGSEWDFAWERYLVRQCSAKFEYATYHSGNPLNSPGSVHKFWLTLNYAY